MHSPPRSPTPPDAPPLAEVLRQAVQAHQAGALEQAESGYAACLARDPACLPALYYGGVLALKRGETAVAVARLSANVRLDPNRAEVWYHLGLAQAAGGGTTAAAESYRRAVALNPGFAPAHNNLGLALQALGQPGPALAAFQAAGRAAPDDPDILLNLGNALADAGQTEAALATLRNAAQAAPADEGLAHKALGALLHESNRLDPAIEAYREALRRRPADPDLPLQLAKAELARGETEASRDGYRRALAGPHADAARLLLATLLPPIPDSEAEIDALRAGFARQLEALLGAGPRWADPYREIGETPFYLSYHGREDDRALLGLLARVHLDACPGLAYTAPHIGRAGGGHAPRIGFVSRYFHDHSVGKTLAGSLAGLTRAGFETHLIQLPPVRRDTRQRAIAASASHVHEMPDDLFRAREAIAALALDALVYPDIGMEPFSYFLAFARLAPVQCVTWGHPVTSGLPEMDYYLSHIDLDPPGNEAFYTETLMLAGRGAIYPGYARPPVPRPGRSRAELGLPEGRPLFVCPQSAYKLAPGYDATLGRLLDAVPEALLMLPQPAHPRLAERLRARWRRVMPGAVERIRFFPPLGLADFCNLVARCDVMLDPFPVGGGVTTFDALATGTPLVTLAGRQMRGRFATACYRQLGLEDWISDTPEAYAQRAIALATDREANAAARRELLQRVETGLYEDDRGVDDLAAFLRQAIRDAGR